MKRFFKFISALIKYIIFGNKVSEAIYNNRTTICNQCDDRCGKKCCVCGCNINTKARWSTESCPKNNW